MKFITEEDLRDLYRKEPFTTYEIEPGARLTPGARQYLLDRGINMLDDGSCVKKSTVNAEQSAAQSERRKNCKKKILCSRMKSMEALFLQTGEELLRGDAVLGQRVIELCKQLSCIRNILEGNGTAENLCCTECTGMNADNFSKDLGDCFEITEAHMQLKKGRDIIILHRLRCTLREIEPALMDINEGSKVEDELYKEVTGKVNQIINTISQMICQVNGGKTCLRTS